MGLVVIVLSLLAARVALAEDRYTDPAGDSGSAPDITAVSVANDAADNITFTVTTNQPALASGNSSVDLIDTDRNRSTGLMASNSSCSFMRTAGRSSGGTARISSRQAPRRRPRRTGTVP